MGSYVNRGEAPASLSVAIGEGGVSATSLAMCAGGSMACAMLVEACADVSFYGPIAPDAFVWCIASTLTKFTFGTPYRPAVGMHAPARIRAFCQFEETLGCTVQEVCAFSAAYYGSSSAFIEAAASKRVAWVEARTPVSDWQAEGLRWLEAGGKECQQDLMVP